MKNEITADREVVITRIFDAPRELVFKAFTEPQHLVHWWGPKGWTTSIKQMDVRPGGVWHYCLRSDADGQESWGKAIYREIVAPERLVYLDTFSDAEGNSLGIPDVLMTIEFAEQDSKTLVTSRALFASAEDRAKVVAMGMVEGYGESWERLDVYLRLANSGER